MTDAQVAGGHKATINNPNTSEEAKEHSRQVLENEFNDGEGKLNMPPIISPILTSYSYWC
jgi:hypothetical protein